MKDMEQHFLKLRADAEECLNISKRATDPQKRDLFARLAQHLTCWPRKSRARCQRKEPKTPLRSIAISFSDGSLATESKRGRSRL
jgi:hypothetical protein